MEEDGVAWGVDEEVDEGVSVAECDGDFKRSVEVLELWTAVGKIVATEDDL